MYFAERTVELRQKCEGFMQKHDLQMKLEIVDGDYHVRFVGRDFYSPVTVVFEGPGSRAYKSASWKRGRLEIECHDLQELGNTGWKCWHRIGDVDHEFEGSAADMLEEAVDRIEDYEVVPMVFGLDGFCDSTQFARAFHELERVLPDQTFMIYRDKSGERVEFQANGRMFSLMFPPMIRSAPYDDVGARLSIDDGVPFEFREHDRRLMTLAVLAELGMVEPTPDQNFWPSF